jgi:CheY-like chemotaxis protein
MRGFHLGADAYLAKPVAPSELDLRIEAVLRRWRNARQVTTESVARALPLAEGADASGLLEHFGLAALLSMIDVERKTGVLTLVEPGRLAELEHVNGRLVRARLDGAEVSSVLDAVCHLLGWRQGSFHFCAGPVDPGAAGPNAARALPTTHLLQQALQRINQTSRSRR